MDRHMVIFALDKRQEKLAELLQGRKIRCTWDWYEKIVEQLKEAEEKESIENIYVLPTTVSKIDKDSSVKEKLKQELINKKADKGNVCIFGGVFDEEWKSFLNTEGIDYWDFMDIPEVVDGNGWITAEATLAEALSLGARSIWKQNVMVTGYGCCGEKIAKEFAWLGANVTIVARKEDVRKQAEKDGFWAIDFPDMTGFVENMDTVVNTVPSMVVTREIIEKMKKDAIIIDIASKPGGTDFVAAKELGIAAKLALGLPGIYTTTSSAELLVKAIERYASPQSFVREDRSWIFQITI